MKQKIKILKKPCGWKDIKVPKGWRLAYDWEILKQFKENPKSLENVSDFWWCNSEGLPKFVARVSWVNNFYGNFIFVAEVRNVVNGSIRVRGVMLVRK